MIGVAMRDAFSLFHSFILFYSLLVIWESKKNLQRVLTFVLVRYQRSEWWRIFGRQENGVLDLKEARVKKKRGKFFTLLF